MPVYQIFHMLAIVNSYLFHITATVIGPHMQIPNRICCNFVALAKTLSAAGGYVLDLATASRNPFSKFLYLPLQLMNQSVSNLWHSP